LSETDLETSIGKGLPQYYLHVACLFEEAKEPEYLVEFCQSALTALGDENDSAIRTEILLKLFQSTLSLSLFDEAYLALTCYTNKPLQRAALRELVGAMVEQHEGVRLCQYPFVGLQDDVDEALAFKCSTIMDVSEGPQFHKVLYAWRTQRGDYRGAASILYERLQRLQTANIGSADPSSCSVSDGFLVLLNALSCVGGEQAWILSTKRAEGDEITGGGSTKRAKLANTTTSSPQYRQVVTLEDVRKDYQNEVERIGLLLNGGFFV